MFKKIAMVTAVSAAFIFGGAFDKADAHADVSYKYNVYYSINGEKGQFSGENTKDVNVHQLLQQIMNKYNINWEPKQVEAKVPEKKVEQPKKQEAPVEKQETKKEETKQPVKQPTEQKVEQPAKQPVQQPVEQSTQQPAKEQTNNAEQGYQLSQFEQEVVELTNQERAKQGLAPLQIDKELSRVAREKSRDMQVNNYFDHNSPVYGSPFDMMKSYGISYKTAGENIAYGQRTPAEVVNAWMESPGHRANILKADFTHIGVGHIEQGNYWTQQFIGK